VGVPKDEIIPARFQIVVFMQYFRVSAVLFIAGLITGCTGFGAVLLALPLLTFLMDMQTAVAVASMATCPIILLLLIQLRNDVDPRKVAPLLLGALPGVPVGVSVLKYVDKSVIHLLLGATLIAYPLLRMASRAFERESGRVKA
jgi:hypothetical protein